MKLNHMLVLGVGVGLLPQDPSSTSNVFVSAHGSMIMPPSRNAIDSTLPPWSGGKHPPTGVIEPYACVCTNGTEPECNSGQGCFWFSQGCTIGCSECDGRGSRIPKWDHCPLESIKPTVNDPKWRTLNQNATPGSDEDIFFFNPWRAPGRAPVFDACGKAGGSDHAAFNAGEYDTTTFAEQGDLGSKVLKPRLTGTVWTRGQTAKARWQYTASHGGGYQYRLCPANETLTEKCFQAMPLEFATPFSHAIVYKDHTDTIEATIVPASVTGTGQWAVNPIPSYDSDNVGCDRVVPAGEHCEWKCPGCGAPKYAADKACPCACAEYYPQYFPNGSAYVGNINHSWPLAGKDYHEFAVEDTVVVPEDIPAGDYVLGWRWDCEQTSQVWSSCADITLV